MWCFAIGHGEFPLSGDHRRSAAEQIDLEVLKFQVSHLLASGLVALPVSVKRRLPAFGDGAAGIKRHIGRVPVAFHVGFELPVVPGFNLCYQHMLNALFQICPRLI